MVKSIENKGEIRVKSLPGYCLDHRYGFYPEDYFSSKFIACFSDSTASTASELSKFDSLLSPLLYEFLNTNILSLQTITNLVHPMLDNLNLRQTRGRACFLGMLLNLASAYDQQLVGEYIQLFVLILRIKSL